MNKNSITERDIKNAYKASFNKCSKEIYHLNLIGSKILLDDMEKRVVRYDNERLFDEFVYFKYYSSMDEKYLLSFFIPIILANKRFDLYSDYVNDLSLKLTRFYGKEDRRFNYMLDVLVFDTILKKLIVNNKAPALEIYNDIKEKLLEYNPEFREKQQSLKFQIEKIKYIKDIHDVISAIEKDEDIKTDIIVYKLYFMAYDSDESGDSGIMSAVNTIKALIGYDFESDSFIDSMSEYILKIRNLSIHKKQYSGKSSPRKFLNLKIGEKITDPILSQVQLMSKDIESDRCILILRTKTGEYRFEYKLKK